MAAPEATRDPRSQGFKGFVKKAYVEHARGEQALVCLRQIDHQT